MKKLGLLAMAFALVMTMTQCKKENTTTSNDEGSKVPITLNVNGNGGSRVAVEGSTGVVTFENGDVIHVVSNGVYVGTMTYNGTVFSGEINEPTEGQKLQFYFLGNKTPEFNSDNTGCSVVISDQTEYLPVISYAPSRENYQIGKTDYNATLLNKCALVKFNVTTSSEAATCITGMNNKVTIDFSTNEFAYGQEGEGVVTLAAGNGQKWGILLPQDEVNHTNAYSDDGFYTGSCATVPTIAENDYLTSGIVVAIGLPSGAIDGLFTVNANGDQVYFSKGNLQYSISTQTWSFMEHQYDIVESFGQDVGTDYANQDVISLFGWGTSGYNHGATAYQPWSTSENINDYYAYGQNSSNLYDQNGMADWGYNAIANGDNQENSGWRTLMGSEWYYLFNTRNTTSGIRWVKGRVNGMKGVILLPDNWIATTYALNGINGGNYNSNTIAIDDWINVLEANGVVFFPAAGLRIGSLVYDMDGGYWASSVSGSNTGCMFFWNGGLNAWGGEQRSHGQSVRLVRNAE